MTAPSLVAIFGGCCSVTGTSNGATAGWRPLQAGLAGGVGGLSGRPGGALEAVSAAFPLAD